MKVKSLSHARLLATPWTAAYQAPLSMGFSRQEYWIGVPLPSPHPPKTLYQLGVTHPRAKHNHVAKLCESSQFCMFCFVYQTGTHIGDLKRISPNLVSPLFLLQDRQMEKDKGMGFLEKKKTSENLEINRVWPLGNKVNQF